MRVGIFAGLTAVFFSTAALADATVEQAQRLLNAMGYNAGPADGAYGKRTGQAITDFLADRGETFDGAIDDQELDALRAAEPDYRIELRYPGRLFDRTYGQQSRCNGFTNKVDVISAEAMDLIEPIPAFNDATSIGNSAQRTAIDPWLQQMVLLAARADTLDDDTSAALAIAQLEKWADAGALLETAVDRRYGGAGDAGSYDADAPAPILDMENAMRVAQVALYAVEMLGDRIPETKRRSIVEWPLNLLRKFAPQFGKPRPNPNADGIWSFDARPALVLAIAEGNAQDYEGFVSAFFALFREKIQPDGAILRNAERGDRAIVYQSLGVNGIANVLHLIESQGTRPPADIERLLHQAVSFLLRADMDSSVIAPYAKVGFDNPGRGKNPERYYRTDPSFLWWAPWYLSRYSDHDNSKLLRVFLADRSARVGIDRQPLASITYPYPSNCYLPFDLGETAVAQAREFVEANFARSSTETVSQSAGETLTVGKAVITTFSERTDAAFFSLFLTGTKIGETPVSLSIVDLIAEFAGSEENLQTLRIVFVADTLQEAQGREADYSECDPMSRYQRDDGRLDLLLHVGFDEELNECVLSKLGPNDRRKWEALVNGFGDVIAALSPSEGAEQLQQFYAQLP